MTEPVTPHDAHQAVDQAYRSGLQGDSDDPSSREVSESVQHHLHENFEDLAEQTEEHNAATGTNALFETSNFDQAQAFRDLERLTNGRIDSETEQAGTLSTDELVAVYEVSSDGERFIQNTLATDAFTGLSGMNLGLTGHGRNTQREQNVESPLFHAIEPYYENNTYDDGDANKTRLYDNDLRRGEVGIDVDTQGKDQHELFQEFLEVIEPGATTGALFRVGNVEGADVQGTIGDDTVVTGGVVLDSQIDTGLGDDVVVAPEIALVDSQIQTSDGDDQIALQGGLQDAVVDGGAGNDDVRFQGVALDSTLALGGDGDTAQVVGQVVDTTILGDQTLEDSATPVGAEPGDDQIAFAGAADNLQILAGPGDDQVLTQGTLQNSLVDGGSDDDQLRFSGHYENSRVELGRGNDVAVVANDFTGDLTLSDPKHGRLDWRGRNLRDQDALLLQGDWTRVDDRTFGRLDDASEVVGNVHIDGDLEDIETIATDGGEVFQSVEPKVDDPPFFASAVRTAAPILTAASFVFPGVAPLAIAAQATNAANAIVHGSPFQAAAAFVSLPGIAAGSGSALAQGTDLAIDGLSAGVQLAEGDWQGALGTVAGSQIPDVLDADVIRDANNAVNLVDNGIDFLENGNVDSLLSAVDQGANFIGGAFADTVDAVTDGATVGLRLAEGDVPGALGAGASLAGELGNEDLARGLAFSGRAVGAAEDGLTLPEGITLGLQGVGTARSIFAPDSTDPREAVNQAQDAALVEATSTLDAVSADFIGPLPEGVESLLRSDDGFVGPLPAEDALTPASEPLQL
ncbi:MAG: hypothetical protein AAF772_11955 [Acidobacteriota bacterium]